MKRAYLEMNGKKNIKTSETRLNWPNVNDCQEDKKKMQRTFT